MSLLHSFEVGDLQVRVYHDPDPESPANWDNLGQIAYTSSRYTLGTEAVSRQRMRDIAAGITSGELVGIPVYALVHSGATIQAAERNPFACQWDSGQSGFVYCPLKRAVQEFGLPEEIARREALRVMVREVEVFDQYLQGDIYGYRIMRGDDEVDSCWGLYGFDYAMKAAKEAAEFHGTKQYAQEAVAKHRAISKDIRRSLQQLIRQLDWYDAEVEKYHAKVVAMRLEVPDDLA